MADLGWGWGWGWGWGLLRCCLRCLLVLLLGAVHFLGAAKNKVVCYKYHTKGCEG